MGKALLQTLLILNVLGAVVAAPAGYVAAEVVRETVVSCYAELRHRGAVNLEGLRRVRGGALVDDHALRVPAFLLNGRHRLCVAFGWCLTGVCLLNAAGVWYGLRRLGSGAGVPKDAA